MRPKPIRRTIRSSSSSLQSTRGRTRSSGCCCLPTRRSAGLQNIATVAAPVPSGPAPAPDATISPVGSPISSPVIAPDRHVRRPTEASRSGHADTSSVPSQRTRRQGRLRAEQRGMLRSASAARQSERASRRASHRRPAGSFGGRLSRGGMPGAPVSRSFPCTWVGEAKAVVRIVDPLSPGLSRKGMEPPPPEASGMTPAGTPRVTVESTSRMWPCSSLRPGGPPISRLSQSRSPCPSRSFVSI